MLTDKTHSIVGKETVVLRRDEGNQPNTTLKELAKLKPVNEEDKWVTAGNASQLSDGAAACVLMDAKLVERRGLQPLGITADFRRRLRSRGNGYRTRVCGTQTARAFGLKVDDIGLWELNEAFAVQVLYCRDRLGIPDERRT